VASARDRRKRRQVSKQRSSGRAPAADSTLAETQSKGQVRSASRNRGADERPPAPWGSFPLVEITVLVGLIMLIFGFVTADPVVIAVGLVLGSLAGLELSVREHFAGYRSHTVLLASTVFVIAVASIYYVAGVVLAIALGVGALAFAAAAYALRAAFRRASGGLSFKFGGLRP